MTAAVRTVGGVEIPVAGVWAIDPAHTQIGFTARHLMVTRVRGLFESFSGTITVGEEPTDSEVEVTIQPESITTHTADRDEHLRSADFLDVENHPDMTFVSTTIEPSGPSWEVVGDLTIRGHTEPVTLDVEFLGTTVDPYGNTKAGFSARTSIEREAWGLTWNAPLESGGVLVSKEVQIEIEGQATLQG